MSFLKIKGVGWCEQCACNRAAYFTKLVQSQEQLCVEGSCSFCQSPIVRSLEALKGDNNEVHLQEEDTAEDVNVKIEASSDQEERLNQEQANNRPTLLGFLLAACCLLFVDQYFL